jgi:hypothetical protein
MSDMTIQTVTISLEVADKEFGNGMSRFVNLKGRYQDGGIPLEEMGTAVEDSLDMFLGAWKSLLAAKFSQGIINGQTLKEKIENAMVQTDKVKAYLRRHDGSSSQPTDQPQPAK